MAFDPLLTDPTTSGGPALKKRAFLVGNGKGRAHFLAKMALYRGQSINCYHLVTNQRRKIEGRNTPNFDAIRDELMKNGGRGELSERHP
jgi:hypothetical protein